MDDFLKKLQNSLEKGEENSEVAQHLNEIDKKADEMDTQHAAENLDKRIKESGQKVELDEEARKNAEKELLDLITEQEENDEKLKKLAQIEAQNSRIRRIKDEFSNVKDEYSKKVQEIYEYKLTLMANFEKKYGKKADEVYDFGDEPSTDLEEYDTQY